MVTFNRISTLCAPLLAAIILLSSFSYNVDFHYCQGQLKSFSLFGKPKNCHEMASKMATCRHHKQDAKQDTTCSEEENNCCNNESIFVESDLDKQIFNFEFFDLDTEYLVASNTDFEDINLEIRQDIPSEHYKPPLIQKDRFVLFESFLL